MSLLHQLGHLDEAHTEQVLERLLQLVVRSPNTEVIDVGRFRSVVATVLFEHRMRQDPEQLRNLDNEWRVLFG